MLKPVIITIYGNVSAGKSPWAHRLETIAEQRGYTAFVNDHRIYSFARSYEKDLAEAKEYIKAQGFDFGVITVGTGNDGSAFKIEIEPFGYSAIAVMGLLTNGVIYDPEKLPDL